MYCSNSNDPEHCPNIENVVCMTFSGLDYFIWNHSYHRLFVPHYALVYAKYKVKARLTGPLWGESIGDQWFPHKCGPVMKKALPFHLAHYNDVIMTTMASQITSLTVVYSTVYSDADQRKHQSSASLAFVWGIHRDRWMIMYFSTYSSKKKGVTLTDVS